MTSPESENPMMCAPPASPAEAHGYWVKGPAWPLLILFMAGGAATLGTDSSSIWRALIGYPFISVFPCLFLLALLSKRPLDFGVILPAAVMIGPVFSVMVGVAVLYIRPDMDAAVWAIMIVGLMLGISSALLGREWTIPRPGLSWLPAIIFCGFAASLVVIACAHGLQMRLLHDGWFHSAVAYKIMRMGVPPEDPVFPGASVHNYWFYHAWGAILSWAFQRPPADMYSFMNVHSLIGVMLGVWVMAVEFFRRNRERMIALFFSILGLNTLGFIYLILNRLFKTKGSIDFETPNVLLQFMVFHGERRIPYFLDKFTPPNAFPLGVCLYAACAYFVILILKKGADAALVLSLFLATLGTFLFHPTTALGVGAGIGVGLGSLVLIRKSIKPVPLWIIIAMGLSGIISLPYLFAIFPFNAESPEKEFLLQNLWNTTSSYPLMVPFLILGIRNCYRSKDTASIFLIGLLAGTTLAALFIKLIGSNQYKFIQLMCIPAGLLSAASFNEEGLKRFKTTLLGIFIIFTAINTVITAYAYVTAPAWKETLYTTDGIHIIPIDKFETDVVFDKWARQNMPENAIIISYSKQLEWGLPEITLCVERSVLLPFTTWVSMGHKGEKEKREMVKRLYGDDSFAPRDIETLTRYNRPIYFVLTPVLASIPRIVAKFDNNPELFKLVYYNLGYQVYLFKK